MLIEAAKRNGRGGGPFWYTLDYLSFPNRV